MRRSSEKTVESQLRKDQRRAKREQRRVHIRCILTFPLGHRYAEVEDEESMISDWSCVGCGKS